MPDSYTSLAQALEARGAQDPKGEAARIWNKKIRKPGEAAMGPNWEERNSAMQHTGAPSAPAPTHAPNPQQPPKRGFPPSPSRIPWRT